MSSKPSEHSRELFRLLVENVEDFAVYTKDLEGYVLSWNPGVERLLGYAEEEWVGRHVSDIFTPEDLEAGALDWEMKTALEHGRAEDQHWHVRKDATRFWANGLLMLLRGEAGEPRAFAKILRDDTRRHRAEEEVRHSREELERRVEERTGELQQLSGVLLQEAKERGEAERQVRGLLRRVIDTQEIERRRVARDLHDNLGQELTALQLRLETLAEKCEALPELREEARLAKEALRRLDAELDFIVWELRPAGIDIVGFRAALENFVHEWSEHYGVKAEFSSAGLGTTGLAPEAEINLYRIAQEALNNVFKHAGASKVGVVAERRDGHVVLIVEDDGKGFEPGRAADGEKGMGLLSMRERAQQLGGTLEIESVPGEGTTIFARVPALGSAS